MVNDLTENYQGIFDFMGESLVYCYKNTIYVASEGRPEAVATLPSVYCLVVAGKHIYIGTLDRTIHVYDGSACLNTYRYKEPLKRFDVLNGEIIGCGEYTIENVSTGEVIEESGRIYAFTRGQDCIYYGGESGVIKILQNWVVSALVQGKVILAIKEWGRFLLIATQDKRLYVRDSAGEGLMCIVGGDNVIDISVNRDGICCVDNNGSLRLWKTVPK